MKTWVLWTVRIVLVGFGLLMAIGPVTDALDSATDLSMLSRLGKLLMGFGWIGIYVSVAIGFRNTWRQLSEAKWAGGRRDRRRATRQIDGKEPYHPYEVAHLRWLAERRVAARRWVPLTLLQFISVIAFTTGYALTPVTYPPTSSNDLDFFVRLAQGLEFLAQALRPVAAVMALGLVVGLVMTWRMRNDVKAQAFLERTQPTAWPTGESR